MQTARLSSLRREVELAQIHFLTVGVDCRAGLNRREAASAKAFKPLWSCNPKAGGVLIWPHPFREFIHLKPAGDRGDPPRTTSTAVPGRAAVLCAGATRCCGEWRGRSPALR